MLTKAALRGRARIRVSESKNAQWFFALVAANGERMATSETYTRKPDALRAAARFAMLVTNAIIVEA